MIQSTTAKATQTAPTMMSSTNARRSSSLNFTRAFSYASIDGANLSMTQDEAIKAPMIIANI
jgi:hypothetical protein